MRVPSPKLRSIRTKLILLFSGTASVTLVWACSTLWVYELVHDRIALRNEESAMAQLVAESSAPALLFYDAAAAAETLAVLRADSRIEKACLYDKKGRALAHFETTEQTDPCPATQAASTTFTRRHLIIFRPIEVRGEVAGSLYINVSLKEMYSSLFNFAVIGGCVMALASLFALGLSSFLQRIISAPILHLTKVATRVSHPGNASLRANRFTDDETGVLIDQFNAMLERIEQRESDLLLAHANLEAKVELRTQDLRDEIAERVVIERDLETARFAAEESNRAKSIFLASMSHELRTPLNAIIGYSEMLHEDAVDAGMDSMKEDLDKVLRSARHLLHLISDVLDISKIEAGQMTVDLQPASVNELLKDVLPTAEVLAKRNHNTLQAPAKVPSWLMNVDPLRFRQSVLNLISNACKFTDHGAIGLAVEEEQIDGKGWLLWKVSDTGPGMSPEGIKKLFMPFSQVDGSATRKHGGTGLGLAISQQLCQSMGGHITVQSSPNRGSIFTIYMPSYVEPGSARSKQEHESTVAELALTTSHVR
jgi:signal transduction histidine kinase